MRSARCGSRCRRRESPHDRHASPGPVPRVGRRVRARGARPDGPARVRAAPRRVRCVPHVGRRARGHAGTARHAHAGARDRARRPRRAGRRRVGGATGVVLSGDGSTVPADGPGGPGTPTLVAAGTTVELLPVGGADVRAELVLTPAAWGTRLDWSCSYPTGVGASGATYELVLVDEAGAREVVATWSATDAGRSDGLGASSAVPLDGIARLELGVTGLDEPLAAADVRTTA